MIFVTFGTHTQPFHRALDLLEAARPAEPLVVQHGATPPRPGRLDARWVEFLEADVMASLMDDAHVVVSHAGVGCTLMSLRAGKKPVLIPRLQRLGEHVDDHQLELADRFGKRGLALICERGEPLAPLIAAAAAEPPYVLAGVGDALGDALVQAALGPPRRRRLRRRS